MASPYQQADSTAKPSGIFHRKASITLEGIEDILARADAIRDVTPDMIVGFCEQRKIDLAHRLARGRRLLYRRYLCHCLEDKRLSNEESEDLKHLATLLHLKQDDLDHIHNDVAIEVYGEAVNEVLDDFKLDEQEAVFLHALQKDLGLTEVQADRLNREGSSMAHDRAMSQAASREDQFTLHRKTAGTFIGCSEVSLEAAVEDGLAKASLAVPGLHWFEVDEISGYIDQGQPKSWHVSMRAGINMGN
jgi:flavin-binding protein dodecin